MKKRKEEGKVKHGFFEYSLLHPILLSLLFISIISVVFGGELLDRFNNRFLYFSFALLEAIGGLSGIYLCIKYFEYKNNKSS